MKAQRQHVYPVGHPEPMHDITLSCWCHPLAADNGAIAIHHAKDGREKWERQGIIGRGGPWQIAYEDIASGDMRRPLFPNT